MKKEKRKKKACYKVLFQVIKYSFKFCWFVIFSYKYDNADDLMVRNYIFMVWYIFVFYHKTFQKYMPKRSLMKSIFL